MKKVLYVLLPQFAEHELPYLTQPLRSDAMAMKERAVSMGAKPVFAPTTEPWGQRTCYVADPEGNLIEISSFVE